MKALNYLQMWHLTTFDAIKYNEWLFTLYNEHSNLSDWAYFLAQPFKPEMITEYFEGWELKISARELYFREKHYENISKHIYFNESERTMYYEINHITMSRTDYIETTIPRTLDEFITDCQRAGFELELKEQK